MIVALVVFYSCTNDSVVASAEDEATIFEKQLTITDKSGTNSITLNISTDDETLLANYAKDNYELIINPEIEKTTTNNGLELNLELSEPIASPDDIEFIKPAVRLAITKVDFKDKVTSYSLVSNVASSLSEEDNLKGINFCRWFPRDYQYERLDNSLATGITTTFNRSKNTCNNIEYHIAAYNSSNPFRSYQLKSPGDQETTSSSGQGMTVYYRYKKNTIVTYTWLF